MSEHGGIGHNGGPLLDDLEAKWASAAHSIFGPSSSAMFLTCLGSLIPHLLAEDTPSYAAAEGTVAHMVADIWLREGYHAAKALVGNEYEQDGFTIAVTDVMLGYLQSYVDWCHAAPGDHYYETRIDISSVTPIPRQFGTADHYALDFRKAIITDLKYGEGVKVYAAEDRGDRRIVIDGKLNGNSQAFLYAWGVFVEWDWFYHFEEIEVRICQPRLDHFDTYTTTREELIKFAAWAKERMKLAWIPNQPRTPTTKGCRWCRIQKTCPAVLAWEADKISHMFQDLDAVEDGTYSDGQMATVMEMISDPTVLFLEPVNVRELTIPQLANVLRYRGLVEGWFRQVSEYLKELADQDDGPEIPFWKLARGRSNRAFGDKVEAEEKLYELGLSKEQVWKERMISPNQAEELIMATKKIPKREAAGLIEAYTIKPPGPPTLVPVNDKREEITPDGDYFPNLEVDDSYE